MTISSNDHSKGKSLFHAARPRGACAFVSSQICSFSNPFGWGRSIWPQYQRRRYVFPHFEYHKFLTQSFFNCETDHIPLLQRCFPWRYRGCTECEWLLRTECSFFIPNILFLIFFLLVIYFQSFLFGKVVHMCSENKWEIQSMETLCRDKSTHVEESLNCH